MGKSHKLNVKGLIFDYGGTLDTDGRHWANVLWEGYVRMAVPISEQQFREAYVYGERALAKSLVILPEDDFQRLLLKKVEIEIAYLTENSVWEASAADVRAAVEGVAGYCYEYARRQTSRSRQVLDELSRHYPMVMVTNFYGNMNSVLRDFGLDTFFSSVVESAVVGVRKPDSAIYRKGLEAIGLPPEQICVVGDSFEKDIQPASSLNCHTVWLKGEEWKPQAHDESLPDFIITSIEQLPDALS